ncbi:MAG: hypothetical protein IPG20_21375 [Gammaproteobacteria bacterium]|jgi:hypothetical protein|nr:hypothetical protein [Gammaproteobacteria bacterium]MCH9835848.1 hypothetical protein [bacterium]
MRDFLKSSTFELPDGEALAIRELSAGGRRALVEVTRSNAGDAFVIAATAIKAGCPEFKDSSVDDILDALPAELLNDLATAVFALSGIASGDEAQAEKN